MIYITCNRNPLPYMLVFEKKFPPDIDFEMFVIVSHTLAFLVLAPTAIPRNKAATLTAGFKKLFQVVWAPLKIFCNLFLEPDSSNGNFPELKKFLILIFTFRNKTQIV